MHQSVTHPISPLKCWSPTTAAIDRGKKMPMLARYGVREYWIVDPVAETIEIYTLAGGAYTLAGTMVGPDEARSPHLPDLSFAAAQVFPS
jgi:Uma2 family endonuclease